MIPNELKKLPNWVIHKHKIPRNPLSNSPARSNDSTTWGTYIEAQHGKQTYEADGVGFMFEPPYIGIDLDHCIDKEKGLSPLARDIIQKVKSYTEISPSGTGIHIICKGELNKSIKEKGFEVYQKGRYFTMTGKILYPIRPICNINFDLTSMVQHNGTSSSQNNSGKLSQSFSGVSQGSSWITEAMEELQPGSFHNTEIKLIGRMHRDRWPQDAIYKLLFPVIKERGGDVEAFKRRVKSICGYNNETGDAGVDSLEEFFRTKESVDWICDKYIARKSLIFIAGLPATLKTWVMMDLAIECAREKGMWLNRFPVKKSRVWFIDQERFKGETQRRFAALMKAKSLKLKDLERLSIRCGSTFRIDLQTSHDAFKQRLKILQPDIVIIDSFGTFHTKNASVKSEIQPVLEQIKQLREEFGCTFIFIHHETKGAFHSDRKDQEPSFMDAEGNLALPAASEFFYTVRKHSEDSSLIYNTKNGMAGKQPPFSVKIENLVEDRSEIQIVGI